MDNGKEQGKGQCENTEEVQQVQVYSTTEANAMWNMSDSNINALNELVRRRLTQTQDTHSLVPSLKPKLAVFMSTMRNYDFPIVFVG